jgi:hypothetical protein
MESKMEMWKASDGLHFRGVVCDADLTRLDAFDRRLLDDCGGRDATAADWLLAIECVFRRAQQQAPNAEEERRDIDRCVMQVFGD